MGRFIMKTFISIFILCFVAMTSFAQPATKIEPVREKSIKTEIKQENQNKETGMMKITDDKTITKVNSKECSHTKECKNESGKDCCKTKHSAKMNKDCCKVKNKMKSTEISKPEDNNSKTEIK